MEKSHLVVSIAPRRSRMVLTFPLPDFSIGAVDSGIKRRTSSASFAARTGQASPAVAACYCLSLVDRARDLRFE